MTRGQDNAKWLFRNVTLARFASVTSCSQRHQPSGDRKRGGAGRSGSPPDQPSSASTNAAGSNGARSSGPSPSPTSFTGTPSSCWTRSRRPQGWGRIRRLPSRRFQANYVGSDFVRRLAAVDQRISLFHRTVLSAINVASRQQISGGALHEVVPGIIPAFAGCTTRVTVRRRSPRPSSTSCFGALIGPVGGGCPVRRYEGAPPTRCARDWRGDWIRATRNANAEPRGRCG